MLWQFRRSESYTPPEPTLTGASTAFIVGDNKFD